MGIQIIVPGVSFKNYLDVLSYPQINNLSSLFFLGGDAEKSLSNAAIGGVNASAVAGSVTFQENFIRFAGAGNINYIQTPELDDTNDMTVITVSRVPQAWVNHGRCLFGDFISGIGMGIFDWSGFVSAGSTANEIIAYGITQPTLPEDVFHFRALTVSGRSITAYLDGIGRSQPIVFDRIPRIGAPIRIGGCYDSTASYNDTVDIAMIAYHKGAMSQSDMGLAYKFVKSYYKKRGITVA